MRTACNDATSTANYMCDSYAVAVADTAAHEGMPHIVLHSSIFWVCCQVFWG